MMVQQDWRYLFPLLYHILPCTLLILLHGIISSKLSLKLGDPTPQLNGGTKFHPMEHIDPIGLLLFVTTGLGWGRFFPHKNENFNNQKKDTLKLFLYPFFLFLALSLCSLAVASMVQRAKIQSTWTILCLWICTDFSLLTLSFALTQLLPIPNTPCFFTIFPLLSQSMQEKLETYHPHLTLALITLLWSGILHPIIFPLLSLILSPICHILPLPLPWITFYFL